MCVPLCAVVGVAASCGSCLLALYSRSFFMPSLPPGQQTNTEKETFFRSVRWTSTPLRAHSTKRVGPTAAPSCFRQIQAWAKNGRAGYYTHCCYCYALHECLLVSAGSTHLTAAHGQPCTCPLPSGWKLSETPAGTAHTHYMCQHSTASGMPQGKFSRQHVTASAS
jgi:hypothetical protein